MGSQNLPVIKIVLPKQLGLSSPSPVRINLHFKSFELNWLEYLKKYGPNDLASKLANPEVSNRLVVEDSRSPSTRKVWTMRSTVKQFVDSFRKNQKCYNASLKITNWSGPGRRRSVRAPPNDFNENRPTTSAAAQQQRSHRAGTTPGISSTPLGQNPNPLQGARTGNVNVNEEEIRFTSPIPPLLRNVVIPPRGCDVESMAFSQDSQDSLSDLNQAGIRVGDNKGSIIRKCVQSLDNATIARVQNELRTVMRGEKWIRVAAKIPFTANILQLIFLNEQNNGIGGD